MKASQAVAADHNRIIGIPGNESSLPPSEPPSLQRRVFDLAWPVISENFLQTMLGIVDTAMVAVLGAAALAGVGTALQIMFFVIAALSATSIGSSVLVAQAIGAQNYAQASHFAKQSLVWSVLISIPLVLTGIFAAETVMSIFRMEPEVTAIGAEYLRVTMGTGAVLALVLLSSGVMRGVGDSRTPMLVTLFANIINVILSYGLIFGELGMPELGVVGSAWGTFFSRLLAFSLLFYFMRRGIRGLSIRGREGWRPKIRLARQLFKIGVPAALEQVLISIGFLVMAITVAQLGTLTLAAHRVTLNAMSVSFLPGIGFALAATALVGQSIGARKPEEARAVAQIATKGAIIWMGTLGLCFLLFAEHIIAFFTQDPIVIQTGAAGLRAIAFVQPFWAITFVQSGALRGTGDTQYPMRVSASGIWGGVIIGGTIALTIGGQLAAIWGAFLLTAPITAYLVWRRFRNTMREGQVVAVVETDA